MCVHLYCRVALSRTFLINIFRRGDDAHTHTNTHTHRHTHTHTRTLPIEFSLSGSHIPCLFFLSSLKTPTCLEGSLLPVISFHALSLPPANYLSDPLWISAAPDLTQQLST